MSPEILHGILIILIIIAVEVVLSFDNAAVLAVIVNKNLPPHQRKKALKYGLFGAYLFRGLSLFMVSWLLANPSVGTVFKILGGLYLIRLAYTGLTPNKDSVEEGEVTWAYDLIARMGIGAFWSTIIVVEFVDLVFSLDNLIAVVSLSENFWIIMCGVAIGILAMRFVAGFFSKLLEKYPSLEMSAYIVIGLLGIKLILSGVADYVSCLSGIKMVMESHFFDLAFSLAMMAIFFLPIMLNRKTVTT